MAVAWKITPEEAWKATYKQFADSVIDYAVAVFEGFEDEITGWMQSNAPWTDRTGDARRTLEARTEARLEYGTISMVFAHGVWYGLFLELSNGGTYAIVGPALDVWSPILWDAISDLGLR